MPKPAKHSFCDDHKWVGEEGEYCPKCLAMDECLTQPRQPLMSLLVSKQPVAWMHFHPVFAPNGQVGGAALTESDKFQGWIERPLIYGD